MKTLFRCAAIVLALLMLSGCAQHTAEPTETTDATTEPTVETTPTAIPAGWATIDGKTYYYLRDGSCMKGRVNIGEHTYYFDSQGILQTGWVTIDGKKFYFGTDGILQTGRISVDGKESRSGDRITLTVGISDGSAGIYAKKTLQIHLFRF